MVELDPSLDGLSQFKDRNHPILVDYSPFGVQTTMDIH